MALTHADDILINCSFNAAGRSAAVASSGDLVQNIAAVIDVVSDNATQSLRQQIPIMVGFTTPNDTDYPNAPVGTIFIKLTPASATASSAVTLYIKETSTSHTTAWGTITVSGGS